MLYPQFGCVETIGDAVAITEQAGKPASTYAGKLVSKQTSKHAGNYVSWQACMDVGLLAAKDALNQE